MEIVMMSIPKYSIHFQRVFIFSLSQQVHSCRFQVIPVASVMAKDVLWGGWWGGGWRGSFELLLPATGPKSCSHTVLMSETWTQLNSLQHNQPWEKKHARPQYAASTATERAIVCCLHAMANYLLWPCCHELPHKGLTGANAPPPVSWGVLQNSKPFTLNFLFNRQNVWEVTTCSACWISP